MTSRSEPAAPLPLALVALLGVFAGAGFMAALWGAVTGGLLILAALMTRV